MIFKIFIVNSSQTRANYCAGDSHFCISLYFGCMRFLTTIDEVENSKDLYSVIISESLHC